MRHLDPYGLEVTSQSEAAAALFADGFSRALANDTGAEEILNRALELDPGLAMARSAKALLLHVFGHRQDAVAQLLAAERATDAVTERERRHLAALRIVLLGDPADARTTIEEHLSVFPRDILLVRHLTILLAYSGADDRKQRVAAMLTGVAPHYGDDPSFNASLSFALSEIGDTGTAERLAEKGLASHENHGPLAHSLSHVYFEAGTANTAREFLNPWLDTHGSASLSSGHLRWHLALAELDEDDVHRAYTRYLDRPAGRGAALNSEDAISLLWRLHVRGVDVHEHWVRHLDPTPSMPSRRPFQDAHRAFALAGLGDGSALEQLAVEVSPGVLPVIDALRLMLAGNRRDAAHAFDAAAVDFARLGGSNEQHAIMRDTVAHLRSP